MPEEKDSPKNNYFRIFLMIAAFVAIVYLIVHNMGTFGNILLVLLGFGLVILVHEFGHFIVAKLTDIKVEAFSIGFPPVLLGILRTENGYRINILPDILKKQGDDQTGGLLNFTIGSSSC